MGVASFNVVAFFNVGFPVCLVRLSFSMGGGAVMLVATKSCACPIESQGKVTSVPGRVSSPQEPWKRNVCKSQICC